MLLFQTGTSWLLTITPALLGFIVGILSLWHSSNQTKKLAQMEYESKEQASRALTQTQVLDAWKDMVKAQQTRIDDLSERLKAAEEVNRQMQQSSRLAEEALRERIRSLEKQLNL